MRKTQGVKDWEDCYRTGETPWDRGSPAPPLLELLEKRGAALWLDGPVLVPGCGTGHDVRALADAGVAAHGLDLSPTAVERARELSKNGAATFEVGDFLDPAWREGRSFPAIWEHTCFCAILPEQRAAYAEAAAGLLSSGGIFAGVFYLTPHDPGEDEESGPPFKTSVEELDQVFAGSFERIDGWVPRRAYPDRVGREWIGIFRRLPQARVAGQAG